MALQHMAIDQLDDALADRAQRFKQAASLSLRDERREADVVARDCCHIGWTALAPLDR